jgi:glyoxylase-like metal-dependent hydrolase (beta-lactamase superfamily II)
MVTVRRITDGVYSIGEWIAGRVHAFLLDDGNDLTVIDTLWEADARYILAQIRALNKEVTQLKHIILTHAHRSHIGGMAELRRLSGARVYSHEWEADILAGEREAQRVKLLPRKPLIAYPIQLGCALGLGSYRPCQITDCLKDGQQVGPVQVIHTPGHTPGSMSFYWKDRKVLFTGDVVVSWPEVAPGWPSLTLNFKQTRESLGRLAEFREVEFLAVGHGEPIARDAAALVRRFRDQPPQ